MGLIYKIACDVNNKCYVGQTRQSLNERIKLHLRDSKNGSKYAIHNAIRKYGWKHFKVEILEDNIPLENLNERELYYTKKFNALVPNGYVLVAGGEPRIMSEETKQKISKSLIGNKRAIGLKHSEKTKRKIRKVNFGKNSSRAKAILCYDLEGNFIKEYGCIRDASRELNLDHRSISQVCLGKYKYTGNYKFKYK